MYSIWNVFGLLLLAFIQKIDSCIRTASNNGGSLDPNQPCTFGSGVPVTIDTNTGRFTNNPPDANPIAVCASCTFGQRSAFTPHTGTATPAAARAAGRISISVACPSNAGLCVCNPSGVCCTPAAGTPEPFQFQVAPFCDASGVCRNNLIVPNAAFGNFQCDDSSMPVFTDLVDPVTLLPIPLNDPIYFNIDSVSCNGCSRIKNNQCLGPAVNV